MLAAQLVRRLPAAGDLRTDGDLLRGFLEHGAEDDFAELVRRHGPLVWGVCCRTLPDVADAEDAFQATFLVLVRRGRKLTSYPTIGPWLHKVAAWTARNVRRRNARRLARQSALPEQLPATPTDLDLPLDIDSALLSLPEKFRSPIVLCHLLGYSRADAAERLGCAEGTLSAWLARGLAKLRARFGGLDPAKPLVVALAAPVALSASVVRAAVASRVAWAASAAVSSTVSQVVEGVMRMFWIKKATALAATVFAVFAFGVGVGITGKQVEGVAEGQEKGMVPKKEDPVRRLTAMDLDKAIADTESKLAAAEERRDLLTKLAKRLEKDIESFRKDGALTKDLLDIIKASERTRKEAEIAAEQVKIIQSKFDVLKAERAGMTVDQMNRYRSRIALEAQRTAFQSELSRLREGLKSLPRQIEQSETALKQIEKELEQLGSPKPNETKKKPEKPQTDISDSRQAAIDRIQKLNEELEKVRRRMAELEKNDAQMRQDAQMLQLNPRRGHLDLIIRGSAGYYEFALRETGADGKEVGTVVVAGKANGGKMLALLLTRTKYDPMAPRELRVLASPSTALGIGSIEALKACDAAGYAKVKYTGYIVSGGFTPELKADQKGEVPGYKHYDNVERKPSELIKEIEKGRVTY